MKSGKNIFSLYLSGQLSLPVAFWGGLVGSSVCLYIFSLWAFSRPTVKSIFDTFGGEGYKLFILIYYSIIFVWTAVVLIGTWRSATRYEGNIFWPCIVKFILILNIMSSLAVIPKTLNNINMTIDVVDNKGMISFFPTQYDSKIEIENKEATRTMIKHDVVRVLKNEESPVKGVYTYLRGEGLSHESLRKLFRPVLNTQGFSAQQIDDYFSFYDSSYHGGADRRLKENKKLVDSLLN